jgi:hypothetical protein
MIFADFLRSTSSASPAGKQATGTGQSSLKQLINFSLENFLIPLVVPTKGWVCFPEIKHERSHAVEQGQLLVQWQPLISSS